MTLISPPSGAALRFLVPIVLSLLSTVTASASPIDYAYSGVITSAAASNLAPPGTPFTGTFTFDPNTNLLPEEGFEGLSPATYGFSGSTTNSPTNGTAGLILQIGGQTIISNLNGLSVNMLNDEIPGYVQSSVYVISYAGNTGSPTATLELANPTQAVLGTNPTLPLSLNPTNLPIATLTVTGPNGDTLYSGTIETFTQVPEPAFASLLSIAAIVWFARSRKSRAPA